MQNNKQKTLILGGAASGKSQYAESLVKASKQKKFYLASANIYDKEIKSKVEKLIGTTIILDGDNCRSFFKSVGYISLILVIYHLHQINFIYDFYT